MNALTGGVAPAFAKPNKNDPDIPIIPTTEVFVPEEQVPAEQPGAPKEQPAPPKSQSPPQQAQVPEIQAPAPRPQAPAPQIPAPRVVERSKADAPRADVPKADVPKADAPKVDAPQLDAPKADAPRVDAPKVDAPKVDAAEAGVPSVDAPKGDVPKDETPQADAPKLDAPAPLPAADQPPTPGDPKQDTQLPRGLAPRQTPEADANASAGKQSPPADPAKAAQRVAMAQPETLQAPEQDIQLARQSKPIEVKPEPAAKQDIDALSSAINLSSKTRVGPFESEFDAGSELSVNADRIWDQRVRQWDRDWIEYDEFYRPIIFNPFRAPVRIAYALANATRILVIQPLARVVVDVAELAAYSFTAVVLGAANVVSDAANVAADVANVAADVVNVAVGTFFGGGFVPGAGVPFVAPPPLLSYDNVPVQVRYSDATYEPFLVRQIVDVGDDVQYGGRKVLLDGATPAWGQWVTSPTGERQFEVHRTQRFPGLGEPREAPLPGDYQMRLASDESAGIDRTQMYLMAAAGVVAGLGFGALGLVFYLGRRRPQP